MATKFPFTVLRAWFKTAREKKKKKKKNSPNPENNTKSAFTNHIQQPLEILVIVREKKKKKKEKKFFHSQNQQGIGDLLKSLLLSFGLLVIFVPVGFKFFFLFFFLEK